MLNTESIKSWLNGLPELGKSEKALRFAATLLLALLLARNSATLTWQLLSPFFHAPTASSPAATYNPSRGALRHKPGPEQAPAQEIALFGQAPGTANDAKTNLPPESAPVTTLNLVLKGVITAQPMSRALAIIAEKGGKNEQLYSLGDKIPGDATIREIHLDRIIISRAGTFETLFLEGFEPQKSSPTSATAHNTADSDGAAVAAIHAESNGNHWQISQKYWDKRLADLPGLAREVGMQIYQENGRQIGYKLISAQGSSLLTQLGLQPGDVILSVNGKPMSNVQNGLAAYQQIKNGGTIRLIVSHNGQQELRFYNVGKK